MRCKLKLINAHRIYNKKTDRWYHIGMQFRVERTAPSCPDYIVKAFKKSGDYIVTTGRHIGFKHDTTRLVGRYEDCIGV